MDGLLAAVVADAQVLDLEHDLGRVRLAPVDDQLDLAADHQLGEVLLVRSRSGSAGRRPCRAG